MKNSLVALVGWLLIISALGFYLYGIYAAIHLSFTKDPIPEGAYPETLATTISSIQALMLTNLGIVLGISIANPQSAVARNVMLAPPPPLNMKPLPPPMALREKIQLAAVVIFLLVLIACLVSWIIKGFVTDEKKIVSIIPESGKMFIGVVLAYVTAVVSTTPGSAGDQT